MESENKTLYVTGFRVETTARELGSHFERYGAIVRAVIPPLKPNDYRSIAFIEYHDHRDAEMAFSQMHDRWLDGHQLLVDWARRPWVHPTQYMSNPPAFPTQPMYNPSPPQIPAILSSRTPRDNTPPRPRHSSYRDRNDEYARSRSPSPGRRSSSKRHHDDDSDYEHYRSSHSSRHRTHHHHHHSSSRHSSSKDDEQREAYSRTSRRGRDDVDRTESAVPSSFRTRDFYTEPVDTRSMQRDNGYGARPRDEGYNGRRRDSGYQARGDEVGRNNTVEKKEDLSIRVKGEKADDLW